METQENIIAFLGLEKLSDEEFEALSDADIENLINEKSEKPIRQRIREATNRARAGLSSRQNLSSTTEVTSDDIEGQVLSLLLSDIRGDALKVRQSLREEEEIYGKMDGFERVPYSSHWAIVDFLINHDLPSREIENIPVRPTQGAARGQCFANVESMVVRNGGRRVNGWMFQIVPCLYMEAVPYCIYEDPCGHRVDVTPGMFPLIAFLVDETTTSDAIEQSSALRVALGEGGEEFLDLMSEGDNLIYSGSPAEVAEKQEMYNRLRSMPVNELERMIRSSSTEEVIKKLCQTARLERIAYIARGKWVQSIRRNDSCPCGSGRKFKRCCGYKMSQVRTPQSVGLEGIK